MNPSVAICSVLGLSAAAAYLFYKSGSLNEKEENYIFNNYAHVRLKFQSYSVLLKNADITVETGYNDAKHTVTYKNEQIVPINLNHNISYEINSETIVEHEKLKAHKKHYSDNVIMFEGGIYDSSDVKIITFKLGNGWEKDTVLIINVEYKNGNSYYTDYGYGVCGEWTVGKNDDMLFNTLGTEGTIITLGCIYPSSENGYSIIDTLTLTDQHIKDSENNERGRLLISVLPVSFLSVYA